MFLVIPQSQSSQHWYAATMASCDNEIWNLGIAGLPIIKIGG